MSAVRLEVTVATREDAERVAELVRRQAYSLYASSPGVKSVTVMIHTDSEIKRERAILAGAEALAKWVSDARE